MGTVTESATLLVATTANTDPTASNPTVSEARNTVPTATTPTTTPTTFPTTNPTKIPTTDSRDTTVATMSTTLFTDMLLTVLMVLTVLTALTDSITNTLLLMSPLSVSTTSTTKPRRSSSSLLPQRLTLPSTPLWRMQFSLMLKSQRAALSLINSMSDVRRDFSPCAIMYTFT